jgi:nucleotide-binding universal stress UspA family protein
VSLAEQGTASVGRCDLIVISTHGRGGLERWVMGSVTERILNATKLPMLIVRPQHKG